MEKIIEKPRVMEILELLPSGLADEIHRLSASRLKGLFDVREISIRQGGVCSLRIGREEIRLFSSVSRVEMDEIMDKLTGGALYAHRDSIAEGFISLGRGIRVGVCGSASYDGGDLVGIKNISSLLIRVPCDECEFVGELREIIEGGIGNGMLIYSPPGVGKTTAIRSAARIVGGGKYPKRVAVIDERGEFDEYDYLDCSVDILRGYKKSAGIEIATRTLSPRLIIIDEIGGEESDAILTALKCGIPILATAHAKDREELLSKPSLKSLFAASVFSKILGIFIHRDEYLLRAEEI